MHKYTFAQNLSLLILGLTSRHSSCLFSVSLVVKKTVRKKKIAVPCMQHEYSICTYANMCMDDHTRLCMPYACQIKRDKNAAVYIFTYIEVWLRAWMALYTHDEGRLRMHVLMYVRACIVH